MWGHVLNVKSRSERYVWYKVSEFCFICHAEGRAQCTHVANEPPVTPQAASVGSVASSDDGPVTPSSPDEDAPINSTPDSGSDFFNEACDPTM